VNREFLLNILFLVAINLLIKPLYLFGIDRTVQNAVGAEAYGLYFALFNFTFLLQIINDCGLQHYHNRNVAQRQDLLGKYLPDMLQLKGVLGLAYFLVVSLLAWRLGYLPEHAPLLLLLAANQAMLSLLFFLRASLSGLGMYRIDSLVSVLDRIILLVVCGFLLFIAPGRAHFRIEWLVLAQSGALLFSVIVAFALVSARAGALRFNWRPRVWRSLLKASYPFALVVFLTGVYTRVDGVMLERMLTDGAEQADYYASAYRLLDAANMIGFLFAGLLFPMFARLRDEQEQLAGLARLSLSFIWAGAGALAASTFFFREEIMRALYVSGGAYSGNILACLMLSYLAISGAYIHGTMLGAGGALRAMNRIALAGLALNVALNIWLIPRYQALGAAFATCCTQFAVWLAQALTARQHFQLHRDSLPFLTLLGYLGACFAWAALACYLLPGPWLVRFVLALSGCVALSAAWRLLDLPYLLQLIRQRA
jgi:O-antigen/teichoic acid export membrane protein